MVFCFYFLRCSEKKIRPRKKKTNSRLNYRQRIILKNVFANFPSPILHFSWPRLRVRENRIRATAGICAARQSTVFGCNVCARVPPPSLQSMCLFYTSCKRRRFIISFFFFPIAYLPSCSLLVNTVFWNIIIIIIIPSYSRLTLVTIIYAINVLLLQVSLLFIANLSVEKSRLSRYVVFFIHPNHQKKKKIPTAPAHSSSTRCMSRIRKRMLTNLYR